MLHRKKYMTQPNWNEVIIGVALLMAHKYIALFIPTNETQSTKWVQRTFVKVLSRSRQTGNIL